MGQVTVTIVESIALLLLQSKLGETAAEVSKACYGTQGPQMLCTRHNLRCSSGRIDLQEAFYMDKTACGVPGVSNCGYLNLTDIQLNGTRYNFNDTELDSLYRQCNTQSTCSLPAGRKGIASFSAIIYACINANSLKTTTPKTTLTTGRKGKSSSVVAPDQTTVTKISNERTQTVTTAGTMLTTRTCLTETNSGWMFAAGLFTGLGIVAFIAGVVYLFHIRRRCILKKTDPGPASQNHPTYTGLTDIGRPDTYDVINNQEAVTRPSVTSQAPVYQNVDDAP